MNFNEVEIVFKKAKTLKSLLSITCSPKNFILPRIDDFVTINDELFKVKSVIHMYGSDDIYISIFLEELES